MRRWTQISEIIQMKKEAPMLMIWREIRITKDCWKNMLLVTSLLMIRLMNFSKVYIIEMRKRMVMKKETVNTRTFYKVKSILQVKKVKKDVS
jgi:hypothetical protein